MHFINARLCPLLLEEVAAAREDLKSRSILGGPGPAPLISFGGQLKGLERLEQFGPGQYVHFNLSPIPEPI